MPKIEKAFLHIFIFLTLVLFLWTTVRSIAFPFGVDYGEAPLMDQVKKIEDRNRIYKLDINEPPYIFLNYPPLYPLLVAGLNLTTRIPLFQAGRLVSLIFSLLSGAIIGLFGFHLTGNKLLGVLAGIMFLGQPYIMIWSSLARVDSMALALSLLGLWILFSRWDSKLWIGLACLSFLASALTRHTYILAGPLAGFTWLWFHDHRKGMLFAGSFIGGGLIIFAAINGLTKGALFTDIVTANINPFSFSRILESIKQLLQIWPLILILCLVAIILTIRSKFNLRPPQSVSTDRQAFLFYGMVFYSLAGFITMLTIGKAGSSINYFMEFIAACIIWVVVVINYLESHINGRVRIFIGLIFIQLLWALAFGFRLSNYIIGTRWQQIDSYNSVFETVKLASQDGLVLSDEYLDMVVLSGLPIYYEPATYVQLYKAGLWNPDEFVSEIKTKTFPLIIIAGNTLDKDSYWPPPLVEAIRENYSIDVAGNFLIITPLSSQ